MNGRCMAVVIVSLAGIMAAPGVVVVAGDPPAAARVSIPSLAERLKTGLRVRAPGDVAFCDAIAMHVRAGRLPGQLVDSTYLWATRRGKEYPFPAFAHVMRIKAAKLGVVLDQPTTPFAAGSAANAGGLP